MAVFFNTALQFLALLSFRQTLRAMAGVKAVRAARQAERHS